MTSIKFDHLHLTFQSHVVTNFIRGRSKNKKKTRSDYFRVLESCVYACVCNIFFLFFFFGLYHYCRGVIVVVVNMDQSYWDLDSILADSVRLPCHFAIDVPGLSHVVGIHQQHSKGGGDDENGTLVMQKKSRVDLPFWMAELLALHNVVDISFPRQYSARVRNALDAQAKSVRLRDLNAWWFAIGVRLSSL